MEERYKQEQETIHAPAELIKKTQNAMKKEEEKCKKAKRNKGLVLSGIVAAATAAIFLIAIPNAAGGFFTPKDNVYLSKESDKIQKIPSAQEAEDLEVQIKIIEDIPKQFIEGMVEETEVLKIPISIIQDEESGYLTACFTFKDTLYLATGGKIDREGFIQAVEDFIKQNR